MRRIWLASLAVTAFAALALASAPTAAAQETLAASCEPPREDSAALSFAEPLGDNQFAQTFTSALSGSLTRAQIDVTEGAGTAGDYVVRIWSVDATGTPVAALATTTIPDASVPEGDSILTALFASPASVVAGNEYAISIGRPTATSVAVGIRSGDDCAHTARSGGPSGSWGAHGFDMVFRVFVTPLPSAAPGLPSASTAQLTCKGEQATQVGTPEDDVIQGTPGPDVIAALGGNDKVSGLQGEDLICGGAGKDTLKGGKGKDILLGHGGQDKLAGGGGKDRCVGGKKDDTAKKCEVEKSI